MGADKNKKIAIYTQLLDLYKKQDEQLKRFTEYVDDLIEKKSGDVFYQGHDAHFKEIEDLEKELKTLLTA